MTASLNDFYTGSSHACSDSLVYGTNRVHKINKKLKKGETIVLMKKQVPLQSSTYKNQSRMSQQPSVPATKKAKGSIGMPDCKNFTVKKKIKAPKIVRPTNTELLLKQANQIAGDTKNLHLLQQAIIEFKTQRDQFVQSLNDLQKRLKEFQIPELFAPPTTKPDEDGKDTQSSNEKLKKRQEKQSNEKADEAGDKEGRKKAVKKKKDVRSVSQHFYLADMTESGEDTSTTSTSAESSSSQDKEDAGEKTLAKTKMKNSRDFNLIPIQPPGRGLGRVDSLMKHNSPWAKSTIDTKLDMLKRSVMEVNNGKKPRKVEEK